VYEYPFIWNGVVQAVKNLGKSQNDEFVVGDLGSGKRADLQKFTYPLSNDLGGKSRKKCST
jgi:hypothetical protein